MGKNEGPLGRFHLGLIQVFGEPLTQRTTVHRQYEKWISQPLKKLALAQTNVQGGWDANAVTFFLNLESQSVQWADVRGVLHERYTASCIW